MEHERNTAWSWRLVQLVARIFPESGEWLRAMLTEIEFVDDRSQLWKWKLGMCVACVRLAARRAITDNGHRPIELTFGAVYLFGISTYVCRHLLHEVFFAPLHEPWSEACIPIAMCFWLALMPLLIGVGVWLCDNTARRLAILFAAIQMFMIALIVQGAGVTEWRLSKFILNVLLMACLSTPKARQACDWRPELSSLKLRDH
jgi:hypothetical protein